MRREWKHLPFSVLMGLLGMITLISLGNVGDHLFVQAREEVSPERLSLPRNNTYYVSPSGDDNHPGTQDQPWRTIQKAASIASAGDIVYIRAGTYPERLIPKHSGCKGQYITFAAYPGERVTLDGETISLPSGIAGLIHISGKDYIKIVGLRVINAGSNENAAGIAVISSSYIIIEGNYTYNTVSSGIGVWSSEHVIVDGNEVELACNDGRQECITIAATDTFEVKNNHVHHSGPGSRGGEGIDAKDGSSNGKIYNNHVHDFSKRVGLYVDAFSKHTYNIEVFGNVVHDVAYNFGLALAAEKGGLLENINIYNNIIYNNSSGVYVSACCDSLSPTHPMRDIRFINNTFYGNGEGSGGGLTVVNPDVENLVIRNNIASQNASYQIWISEDVPKSEVTRDHNWVEDDPMLVDPASGDFHLMPGSPLIDAGSSVSAPSSDFEGDFRPQGAGYDIGADEYRLDLEVTPSALVFWTEMGGRGPAPRNIQVRSRTGSATNWTAVVSPTVSWLDITPTSGTTPATITAVVNISGLGTLVDMTRIHVFTGEGVEDRAECVEVTLYVLQEIYKAYLAFLFKSGR